jgi:large subunit ribosomal protein L15
MPFRIRPQDKTNTWRCNEDPKKLNDFYAQMLGQGGEQMLSEEVKWLAVTHKSFDQGRRGFNDRLSYFGRFHQK